MFSQGGPTIQSETLSIKLIIAVFNVKGFFKPCIHCLSVVIKPKLSPWGGGLPAVEPAHSVPSHSASERGGGGDVQYGQLGTRPVAGIHNRFKKHAFLRRLFGVSDHPGFQREELYAAQIVCVFFYVSHKKISWTFFCVGTVCIGNDMPA